MPFRPQRWSIYLMHTGMGRQLPEVTATLSSVKLPTAVSHMLASSRHLCGL